MGVIIVKSGEAERNNEELSQELRELIKKKEEELSTEERKLLCKINAECPPGYTCIYGKCVKSIIQYHY